MEDKTYFVISSKFGIRMTCNIEKLIDLVEGLRKLNVPYSVKQGSSKNGPFVPVKDIYAIG